MRRALLALAALGGSQAGAAPPPASAPVELAVDSVDWLTERAIQIVEGSVATITPIGPMSIAPRGGFQSSIEIEAVVKGRVAPTVSALWRGDAPRIGDRVLAFIAIEMRLANPGPGGVPEAVITHLTGAHGAPWRIATRRFAYATGRPDVIAAIRPRINVTHWGSWVGTRVPATSPLGRAGVTTLRLPIDDDTEAYARALVHASDIESRRAGVQLLREFESGQNIETVLALVKDPDVGPDAITLLRAWEVPLAFDTEMAAP